MPAERYYGQLTFHAPEGDLPPLLRDTSMTNAAETEALVPDEPSTSLTTRREHSVGIPFEPSITAVAQGQVEGAWSISALGDDWTPEGVFVLPEGEALPIGKGSAIRVQSSDGWHHCEFPQPGVLHGPALWTMAEPTSERDLLRNLRARQETELVASLAVALGFFASPCAIAFLIPIPASSVGSFIYLISAAFAALVGATGAGVGAFCVTDGLLDRLSPRTISSVNRRVSKVLRMPRSVFLALGAPQPHLKLVSPALPMDDLDREIRTHLESYRAHRAQLSARKVASGPMVEHAATMIDEIETRLKAGTSALREDGLRQTYLDLIRRAEADATKLLLKKEAEEAEGVVRDMSALIKQMDLHQA